MVIHRRPLPFLFVTIALKMLVQVTENIRLFPIAIQEAHLGQVSIGDAKQKLLCQGSLTAALSVGSWVSCIMMSSLLSLPTRSGTDWFHQLSNCLPQDFWLLWKWVGVRSLSILQQCPEITNSLFLIILLSETQQFKFGYLLPSYMVLSHSGIAGND